jgi:hypothetical protein
VTALAAETVPTVQVAVLSPRAQPLLKVGFWLDGAAVRATDTPVAEPPLTETETENPAVCPRGMLDCARATLTQSSAAAAVALPLALGLADVLALALGLVWMYALSEAETVAEGRDDPDGNPDADADGDAGGEDSSVLLDGLADGVGEPVPDLAADGDGDGVREGDGEVVRVGDGDAVRVGDGDGDVVRDGDGDGDGDVVRDGDGDGEGDGEPLAGRGPQVVSVFADDVEVVPDRSKPARAMAGQLASTPTIRQRPASMLSVDTRTCANRI